MQRVLAALVPEIALCESEYVWLMEERLRAQRDALARMGYPEGFRPVLGVDPVATLTGCHRGSDGVLRASVVVYEPQTRQRYRRRLAAPKPRLPGLEPVVHLRGAR